MLTLGPRLMSIADDIIDCGCDSGPAGIKAPEGRVDIVCDIGTDHAFLPIWLITNECCRRAVATDKKTAPLKKAAENIKKYCVGDRITLHCGDGFDAVDSAEEGHYVVISGVGGILLTEILGRGAEKAKKAGAIAVQPMNNVPYLRRWLNANGYMIKYEKLALEDRRVYNLLFCKYTGASEEYSDTEYIVGKRFTGCADEALKKYLSKVVRRFRKEAGGILRI